ARAPAAGCRGRRRPAGDAAWRHGAGCHQRLAPRARSGLRGVQRPRAGPHLLDLPVLGLAMSRWIKWGLLVNLAIIAVLVFAYPQLMVSPGKVQPAHVAIEKDCFACHLGFRGASADKCTACHQPADIGRLTTTGLPIVDGTPFHQELARQDCTACHREHTDRLAPADGTLVRFDHSMLLASQVADCKGCHTAPDTRVHRGVTAQCSQCHATKAWEPATFDHDRYFPLVGEHRASCETCHPRNATPRYN